MCIPASTYGSHLPSPACVLLSALFTLKFLSVDLQISPVIA